MTDHLHLRRDGVSLLIDCAGPGQPEILHWGGDLGALTDTEVDALRTARTPALANSVVDVRVPHALLPERAAAWRGRPGLAGARADGSGFAPLLQLTGTTTDVDAPAGTSGITHWDVVFDLADTDAGLEVRSCWALDGAGVLSVQHTVRNAGTAPFALAELGVSLPVPARTAELLDFTGRWCYERGPVRRPFQEGAVVRENRRGRTGADAAFVTVAGTPGFANRRGELWATHLAWSGDQVSWAEAEPDGTRALGAAELLAPGEVSLAPGDSYTTPTLVAAYSAAGLDGISNRFHRHLRARPTHPASPRPAVLNTWEAVYFDQNLAGLSTLADAAAAAGLERFVLDDGWFGGRRDDTSSLGDWTVSSDVWPDGLTPLIDHVTGLGLQFGLWVEPEMINADSDLYRAHPDWVLGPAGKLGPEARHQHVLDLANPDAWQHIHDALDRLLTDHDIAYLKWDHNRDLVAATHAGRAGVHAQTAAVYRLFDALKAAHPGLEIESCSSGGARVDLGVLARTDRVWASDCNDALERQMIQRWTNLLLPLELIGSHVGPPTAHTTGRTHELSFRAATALFGHFGAEWDIASATDDDRAGLTAAAAIYRRLRDLLHTGTSVHADHPDDAATFSGVVAADRSTAVFAYVQLRTGPRERPAPARFVGLDPDRRYTVTVLDVAGRPGTTHRAAPAWLDAGSITLSGRLLESVGLELPILQPEQALVLELVTA